MIKLYRIITCIGDLIKNIESKGLNDENIEKIYNDLLKDYNYISKLAGMIDKCIDMSSDRPSEYMVRADTQPNLSAIKKSMDEVHRKIKAEKEKVEEYLRGDVEIS